MHSAVLWDAAQSLSERDSERLPRLQGGKIAPFDRLRLRRELSQADAILLALALVGNHQTGVRHSGWQYGGRSANPTHQLFPPHFFSRQLDRHLAARQAPRLASCEVAWRYVISCYSTEVLFRASAMT